MLLLYNARYSSQDNTKCGERRRVGASCQIPGFSLMAGGHDVRVRNGDRMRYRTMHKMYDYGERFGPQILYRMWKM
ncbi:MAG: 4Fe-4S dicluster domain-containing protein [Clostridium paraputrificum]